MQFMAVMLLSSTVLLMGCAVTREPPAPLIGVDIMQVKAGDKVVFDGTLMSNDYLDRYLEWKDPTVRDSK